MVRHLFGNFHQGLRVFAPVNGYQCTSVALLALFMFMNRIHEPQLLSNGIDIGSVVTPDILDDVIVDGTRLYLSIIGCNTPRYLSHNDLPQSVQNINGQHGIIQYTLDMFYGRVSDCNLHEAGEQEFHTSFIQSSLISPYMLMTFGESSIAVYSEMSSQNVFVFDSHQRNELGLPDSLGSSVLVQFDTFDEFIQYVNVAYSNQRYDITPVTLPMPIFRPENVTIDNEFPKVHLLDSNSTNVSRNTYLDTHNSREKKTTKNKQPPKRQKSSGNHFSFVDVHNYCKLSTNKQLIKKKKKASKHCSTQAATSLLLNHEESVFPLYNTNIISDNGQNVAHFCVVETENLEVDFLNSPTHSKVFEEHLRERPSYACSSCKRFLFKDQIYCLKMDRRIATKVVKSGSILCSFCHSKINKNQIPYMCTDLNQLDVGLVPEELTSLSTIERRLIALIEVFMTILILPGGQFAEKGLVLNLPNDVQCIANQLPKSLESSQIMTVHYMHQSHYQRNHSGFAVDSNRIHKALSWLHSNNDLYKHIVIKVNDNLEDFTCGNVSLDSFDTCTVTPLDNSVPNLNVSSFMTDKTINVPHISEAPVNIYELDFGEEKAFPWLFPHGKYGWKHARPLHIPKYMYFKSRLYDISGMFRKNMTYLLHAAVSYNVSLLKSEINVQMRIHNSHFASQKLTVEHIKHLKDYPTLQQNSYMFMKNIRGTVAYFRNQLYNLLAMFKCLGPPTLFMTLSADDLHWPELGMTLYDIPYENAVKNKTLFNKMRSDPVMTAIHFERRFKALMKHVIFGEKQPLGQVKDYFARVEFQNRGSPHIHMFLWVEGIPNTINSSSTETLCSYINKTIHSSIPPLEQDEELHHLVAKLQKHKHTSYCTKLNKQQCRFGFPKQACAATKISYSGSFVHKRKRGKFYATKRTASDSMINSFNSCILRHWRANMDVQMVCNAEGAAYYVCSYICKSEPDELKNALGKLIHDVFKTDPTIPKHIRLFKIGICVLRHRRMSSQEAAYRLTNLNLIHTSRSFVYLNTRNPKKRYKILKPKKDLDSLPDNSTDIFQSNFLEYYHERPVHAQNMCLFYFCSWYQKCYNFNTQKNYQQRLYIAKYGVWLRKCRKANVVRFPTFPPGSEDYFYSMLLLLLPHTQEDELITPYLSYKNAFINKRHLFDQSVNFTYFSFTESIENCMRQLILAERLHGSNETSINQDNSFTRSIPHDYPLNNIQYDNVSQHHKPQENENSSELCAIENFHYHALHCTMSVNEYQDSVQRLTASQKNALNFVQNKFQTGNCPFHLFISGGAGVGKTFTARTIIAFLELYTCSVAGASPVIVCAPTGTAANNVNGNTLHHIFKIPVTDYLEYQTMSPALLKKLQQTFRHIHTVIIDEISMVSGEMLSFICRRLSEISCNDSAFGNYNIICIGDFFQLKPVRGCFAFQNKLLWELFHPVFLKENLRQKTDNSYFSLLNRARLGILTDDDKNALKSRLIIPTQSQENTILHMFPCREDVIKFNTRQITKMNVQTLQITAKHFFSESDMHAFAEVPDHFIPSDNRLAGGLELCLTVCVGARVMLIRNIDTLHGLVNGVMGTVADFSFHSSTGYPSAVLIMFDDPKIGKLTFPSSTDNQKVPVSIKQIDHEFIYRGRHIIRRQFPLVLSWACTIHKMQGISLQSAVIDLGSSVFDRGMSYVALSRVCSLSGLYLLQFDSCKIQTHKSVVDEYERLLEISEAI